MRRFFGFLIWVVLLTPAINIGRAWQSSFYPGPTVAVSIAGNVVRGHMSYAIDGAESVIDEYGAKHRLDERSVISSTLGTHADRDFIDLVMIYWPTFVPVLVLTILLALYLRMVGVTKSLKQ